MYLSELDAYFLLYNVDKPLKVLYLISALLVNKRSSRTSIFNKVFIIFFYCANLDKLQGWILYYDEGGLLSHSACRSFCYMSSEKGNRCFLPPLPSRLKQAFTRDLWHPLTSVPLPVRSSPFDQRRIAPISQETLWERGV